MAAISPLSNDSLEPADLYGRWEGVLHDRALRDLPYRIEINKWGHLEMTPPATPHHMRIGTRLARLLDQRLGGEAFTECAILTSGGVRIADVVWCSPAFLITHGGELDDWAAALSQAPDLCVEVRSPSNPDQQVGYGELQERIALFLASGAREAWILHPTGRVDCFGADGPLTASRIVPDWAQSVLVIKGAIKRQR
ncbi:MAG: Uma2 family endonuclease [Beggiatoa sp.]|nr:Uma2 family endonuclease [Beggiatoa sp.]